MRIIQQKRRKPCDVTHRGHLCEYTVFSQPMLWEQNNFLFGTKPQQTSSYPDWFCYCLDNTFTCTCVLNRPHCLTSCCWGKASTPTERNILREMWVILSIKTLTTKCWDLKSHIHTHTDAHIHTLWNSQWVDWLMTFLHYQLIQTQRHKRGLTGSFLFFLIIRKCLSLTIKTSQLYNHFSDGEARHLKYQWHISGEGRAVCSLPPDALNESRTE